MTQMPFRMELTERQLVLMEPEQLASVLGPAVML